MITSRRRFLGWLAAAPVLPGPAQKIAEALAREPESPIIRYASCAPGEITAVNITSAGFGYTTAPVVTLTDSRLVTSRVIGAELAAITRRAEAGRS